MKHIVKKWLAGILSVVMVFSLLPVMARAEEDGETPEKTAVERVQALIDALPDAETITEDNRADMEAKIDAIDGAMAELSEDEAAALDTARYDAAVAALSALADQTADPDPEPSAAERVQALIDALPDAETITEDNRADVEAQLAAIDEAKQDLTDDEMDALDITRYMAAVEAILALDNMAGANEPETMDTEFDVSTQPVNIDKDGDYTIKGNTTANTITVTSGTVTITLNGVSVTSNGGCAFDIEGGDVTLVLAAGTTNSFTSAGSDNSNAGIHVAENAHLTIRGTGALNAVSEWRGAGIGGNQGGNAGYITIESGNITAKSNADGAGIGGGHTGEHSDTGGTFQSITITGGKVTAEGGGNGAGIGCGCWAKAMGTITISGGEVHAKSVSTSGRSYDIGYGHKSSTFDSNITISGGVVFTEGSHGRGIGAQNVSKDNCIVFTGNSGQVYGNPTITGDITIPSGKTLTVPDGKTLTVADGVTLTVAVGATLANNGYVNNSGNIVVSGGVTNNGTIINIKDKGTITGAENITGDPPETVEYSYLDWDPDIRTLVKETAPVAPILVTKGTTTWDNNWYVVVGSVTISDRITVSGDVHLILMDGCSLTAQQGITVDNPNRLTIYGQSGQTGSLSATSNPRYNMAAIGGGSYDPAGSITINGGIITAICTSSGAGIGASLVGDSGTITINGGTVNATGGDGGAGIGGFRGDGGKITINGGTVTATGSYDTGYGGAGAGIGGGSGASAGTIIITGGTVTANGSNNYSWDPNNGTSGIGCGLGGDGGTIIINGGSVTANGGTNAAGIGCGSNGTGVGFSTGEGGNAVIHASISDTSKRNSWSGVFFEGNSGQVYGNPTPTEGFEVKSNETLTVLDGASLTVADGVTLTNNGKIYVGSMDGMNAALNNKGTIINKNLIDVWGQLTNGEAGIQNQGGRIEYHFKVDVTAPNFTSAQYGYQQPSAQQITIKNNGQVDANITSVIIDGSGFDLITGNIGNVAKGNTNESWSIQPKAGLGVGTHTATITVTYSGNGGTSRTATAEVTFTVIKAIPTVTPPKGNTLTYTGEAQNLVTGGTTSGGEMQYSLDGRNYSATIPTGTEAKEYTVWYKVVGNDNYNDTEAESIKVTIGKGEADVTGEAVQITYGQDINLTVKVAVKASNGISLASAEPDTVVFTFPKGGTMTATVTKTTGENGTASVTIAAEDVKNYFEPGVNNVTVSYGGSGNLNEKNSVKMTVTVNPKTLTFTFNAQNKEYDGNNEIKGTFSGSPQGLVSGDSVEVDTYTAYTDDANAGEGKTVTVTVSKLKGSEAGYYTPGTVTSNAVEIRKAAISSVTPPTAKELTYNGGPQDLVTAPVKPAEGTMMYALGENGDSAPGDEKFSATIPSETNAGTYYVWYYVQADANHEDSGKQCVTVTIKKAEVTFTVTGNDVPYDTNAHTATVKQTENESPKLNPTTDFSVTYGPDKTANKTNVGEYEIYVTLNNYNFKFKDTDDAVREKKLSDKLTINKVALELTVSGSDITYGQTLSESKLSGTATIKDSKTTINGTWAWDAGVASTYPTVKTDSGKTDYKVIFTPTSSEAENFTTDSLSTKIKITVKPYELTPVVVESSVSDKIYDGNTSVADGTLTFDEDLNKEPFSGNMPTATGNFEFVDKNVGTNKHVNVNGITLSNSEDYALKDTTITDAVTNAEITAKEVSLTWQDYENLCYDKNAKNVTATTKNFVADDEVSLSYKDNDKVNAGTYTATAELAGTDAGNYTISNPQQEYTITPAKVSFTIGAEDKVDWATRGETNDNPNPDGYKLNGEGTAYVLSMTYDSYKHKASVSQKADEAVEILPAGVNGFTVTYKKDDTGEKLTEIRDAGTYDIMVNLTPTEGDIYNYAFAGQSEDVYSLKIGEITVEPYTVHVTWSHLKYVYHAHNMHPNVRVQNAFKADVQPNVVPDGFDPAVGYSGELLAFAETSGADVGNYDVEVELYGTSAGNYTVDDNTETVTIVPAPVTFTVGDNVWVIDNGTVDRTSVTLRPTWGAVSTTPDVAVHHSYPLAGTKITEDLGTEIVYKKDGEEVTSPSEAGKYEVWVKIGNENYRHSATETGELHHVGELVITDDPDSIRTYTVTFDPGYEGAPEGPAAIEKAFPNQTVVLPPVSGENEDGTTYDITREGYSFLGWSYNGHTYQPNEELHMPAADVTFKGEWIEAVPIGGRVVQESSGGEPTPVNGATVVLKQGSEPTAEAVTGSDGTFDFGLVMPGIYNLEVTYENGGGAKIVKTFLIEVGDSGSVDNEFVLPDTALNTVVEVAPGIKSAVSMDGMITDEAAADVYTESDKKTVAEGGTVEFKMSISETTLTDDQEEEIPVPEERISMVLDMKLTKTVTSSSGTNTTEITDSKIPVTTVIHLPAEIQGKSGYTVYRFHDEDGDGSADMRAITTSKNENGEYLEVIRDGTAIELHAEFYSTYVLTWYQSSGGGATAYPVTLPENALNGTVTANYEKAVKNSVVTLTVTPDEGHVLGELTVTDSEGNPIALTDNGDGTYTFVMPDGGVTVKAVFNCEGGENCQSRKFTDLDVKAWYHDYTDYVIGCGLMHGVGGSLFDPNGAVTRAQMVTVLWNMSGDPVVNYYMTYSDVSESAWYAEAIRWATSEGVVDGYGNGKFGPNDVITREQMATMLYRYERKYGDGGFTGEWMYRLPFTDLDQISDWAFEAVAWCNMKGIITGKDGNRLDPKGPAKRCEMAAVLARYRAENDTKNDTE